MAYEEFGFCSSQACGMYSVGRGEYGMRKLINDNLEWLTGFRYTSVNSLPKYLCYGVQREVGSGLASLGLLEPSYCGVMFLCTPLGLIYTSVWKSLERIALDICICAYYKQKEELEPRGLGPDKGICSWAPAFPPPSLLVSKCFNVALSIAS